MTHKKKILPPDHRDVFELAREQTKDLPKPNVIYIFANRRHIGRMIRKQRRADKNTSTKT